MRICLGDDFPVAVLSAPCVGTSAGANPVNKVIKFLTDLKSKIKVERLEAHRVHKEFTAWCKTQSSDLTLAVETGSKEKADLVTSLVLFGTKISGLDGSIATTKADLKAATAFRAKEQVDFARSEQELLDVIDILAKAMRR